MSITISRSGDKRGGGRRWTACVAGPTRATRENDDDGGETTTAACGTALSFRGDDDPEALDVDEEEEVSLASETAHMLAQFPIRFRVGVLELSEDVVKAVTLLLLGLAALFIGVSLPVL